MEKEEYYQLIKDLRAKLASEECKGCSCPKIQCEWHGDCYKCVRQHCINGNHVPNCLQFILDEKIASIAEVAEMTVAKKSFSLVNSFFNPSLYFSAMLRN